MLLIPVSSSAEEKIFIKKRLYDYYRNQKVFVQDDISLYSVNGYGDFSNLKSLGVYEKYNELGDFGFNVSHDDFVDGRLEENVVYQDNHGNDHTVVSFNTDFSKHLEDIVGYPIAMNFVKMKSTSYFKDLIVESGVPIYIDAHFSTEFYDSKGDFLGEVTFRLVYQAQRFCGSEDNTIAHLKDVISGLETQLSEYGNVLASKDIDIQSLKTKVQSLSVTSSGDGEISPATQSKILRLKRKVKRLKAKLSKNNN